MGLTLNGFHVDHRIESLVRYVDDLESGNYEVISNEGEEESTSRTMNIWDSGLSLSGPLAPFGSDVGPIFKTLISM